MLVPLLPLRPTRAQLLIDTGLPLVLQVANCSFVKFDFAIASALGLRAVQYYNFFDIGNP